MPPVIIDTVEQGTPGWFALKLGKPGGTSIGEIVQQSGKPSTSRQKFLYRLAGETLSGERVERKPSGAMLRGVELEPEARSAYELLRDVDVRQVAHVFADERELYGVSPDGLVGDDGVLEIKCPEATTMAEYLDKQALPSNYWHQCHGSLAVTGREWLEFFAYHPNMRPFALLVERDEAVCRMITEALEEFCSDLAALVERLR